MEQQKTGYVACNYTEGDMLAEVEHGEIYNTDAEARTEAKSLGLDGVRYVGTDGYLYVDAPEAA